MPYCVVTAAAAAAVVAGAQEEVRIFYQRYGHGATKVLLIIGTARLSLSNCSCPKFDFPENSTQSDETQVSRGRTSRGARR